MDIASTSGGIEMPRDLISAVLAHGNGVEELEDRETQQLLNPVGFDPSAALLNDKDGFEDFDEAA